MSIDKEKRYYNEYHLSKDEPPPYGQWCGPSFNHVVQQGFLSRSNFNTPSVNNSTRYRSFNFKKKGSGYQTPICYLDKDVRFNSFLGRPSSECKKTFNYKKLGAGGIIIDKDGKLLVVKGLTKWSLPKGHLEPGEKYHECAMREIKEEVNLKIHLGISDRYIDVKKCIYYIIVLSQSGPKDLKTNDPNEISEIKWLLPEEIRNLECNRQLDYVIDRWGYIQNIIKTTGKRLVRYPVISNEEPEEKKEYEDTPIYFVPDFTNRQIIDGEDDILFEKISVSSCPVEQESVEVICANDPTVTSVKPFFRTDDILCHATERENETCMLTVY